MCARTIRFGICLATGVVCAGGSPSMADWPNFRGPEHNGISSEAGFRKTWSSPIPLLWERVVGDGFSSFACVGDRVYTCGTETGRQVIFSLAADSVRGQPAEPSRAQRDEQGRMSYHSPSAGALF